MKSFIETLKHFWNEEEGMEMVEYAVVGALLVVGIGTTISGLKGDIGTTFGNIGNAVLGN